MNISNAIQNNSEGSESGARYCDPAHVPVDGTCNETAILLYAGELIG